MALCTNERIINTWFANDAMNFSGRINVNSRNFYEANKDLIHGDIFTPLHNDIINSLINKVGMTVFSQRSINNPLNIFQKEDMKLGAYKETIAVDIVKGEQFEVVKNGESFDQFKIHDPDIKAAYQDSKREDVYWVTKRDEHIQYAFNDPYGLNTLMNEIIGTLIDSDRADSYIWAKKLIHSALNSKSAPLQPSQVVYIPDIREINLDPNEYKTAIAMIKKTVELIQYNSRLYNAGSLARACPKTDLTFIFDTGAQVSNEVMNMSTAYNAKYVTMGVEPLKVDDFGEGNHDVIGLAMSSKAITIHDKKRAGYSKFNIGGLYLQNVFHIWQILTFNPFETLVVFKAGTKNQIEESYNLQKPENRRKLEIEASENFMKKTKSENGKSKDNR